MKAAKAVLLATLLVAGKVLGQVEEKEPAAILEIGGAGDWALTHGKPAYGPSLAVGVTPIKPNEPLPAEAHAHTRAPRLIPLT